LQARFLGKEYYRNRSPKGQKLSACGDCFFKTCGKKIFAFSAKFLQTFPASLDGNNFAVSKPMNQTDRVLIRKVRLLLIENAYSMWLR
jgi:hypothetical protein